MTCQRDWILELETIVFAAYVPMNATFLASNENSRLVAKNEDEEPIRLIRSILILMTSSVLKNIDVVIVMSSNEKNTT